MGWGKSYGARLVRKIRLKVFVIQPSGQRVVRVPRLSSAVAPDGVVLRFGQFSVEGGAAKVVPMFRLLSSEDVLQAFLRDLAGLGGGLPATLDVTKAAHRAFADRVFPHARCGIVTFSFRCPFQLILDDDL